MHRRKAARGHTSLLLPSWTLQPILPAAFRVRLRHALTRQKQQCAQRLIATRDRCARSPCSWHPYAATAKLCALKTAPRRAWSKYPACCSHATRRPRPRLRGAPAECRRVVLRPPRPSGGANKRAYALVASDSAGSRNRANSMAAGRRAHTAQPYESTSNNATSLRA